MSKGQLTRRQVLGGLAGTAFVSQSCLSPFGLGDFPDRPQTAGSEVEGGAIDPLELVVVPAPPGGSAFLMMKYEVTQALYEEVMGNNPSYFNGPQRPVENVSWEDGIAFCNALSVREGLQPAYHGTNNNCTLIEGANGYRLPFEAEWEWAARGGEDYAWAGSSNPDEVAWYYLNSGGETRNVGEKQSNGYGLYDMSGNVSEWCADDYLYPGEHRPGASGRVFRGGGWDNYADYCRVSYRYDFSPDYRFNHLGLRLSRSLPEVGDSDGTEEGGSEAGAEGGAAAGEMAGGAVEAGAQVELLNPPELVEIPAPSDGFAFLMMKYQVTQALYEEVMGTKPSRFIGSQRPVERVSWEDGIAFCNALSMREGLQPAYHGTDNDCTLIEGANGYRLPFEAEWEWAARGGEDYEYAGSDNIDAVAWYEGNSGGETHPVGQKQPNGYGLYDMSGNVWEWCADDYSNLGEHQPGASERVLRGGGWSLGANFCRVSFRFNLSPILRVNDLGLRLCRPLIDEVEEGGSEAGSEGGAVAGEMAGVPVEGGAQVELLNPPDLAEIPAYPGGSAFLMMKYEVTQALYEEVMGTNPSSFIAPRRPVEQVSWEDGIAFCNALSVREGLQPAYNGTDNDCTLIEGANGYRLPFEAEWEWAARGGVEYEYAGSDSIDEVAWYDENSGGATHNVGEKQPNGYGLYDMSGNVWEWCADDWDTPGEHRPGAPKRVRRGGSWYYPAVYCRLSRRSFLSPDYRFDNLGLRLSRSL